MDGLFNQIPLLRLLIVPAIPFIQLQRVVPFGGLLLFFVLFLGVVRNPNVPYFLRFNALQALLTDIVVIVLSFAFSILLRPIGGDTLLVGTLSSTVVIAVLAVMAELDVDAFFVLSDRISESSLASHLVVENLGTRFHDHVAVFGDVAFNFFLRDVRTKDVHGLVIRIERHGLCRRGDFRLTEVSDGSNTLSPCAHRNRSLVQLHAHGLAEPWQVGFTPPQTFDDCEHQDR